MPISAYVKVDTEFTDKDCLVTALKEMGYTVEVGESLEANGYTGEKNKCQIVVRKGSHHDVYYEDMFFVRQPNGSYSATISSHMAKKRVAEMKIRFAELKVKKIAKQRGYAIVSQKTTDGKTRMVLRRYSSN